jgi:hypothetical protein
MHDFNPIKSDQPGRVFAIFVLMPFLIYKGRIYNDKLLFYLGILFGIYELYWITSYAPKRITF